MANHCYNYGYFVGSRKEIKKLLAQAQKLEEGKEVRYRESTPTTAEVSLYAGNYAKLLMNKPDKGENGLYSPNFDVYEKYGSKWFDAHFELQEYHNEDELGLVISGDSAWSPMLPLFVKLCKKYKLTCEGNYEEMGMDFAGEFEITATGEIMDVQMTYRESLQKNNPECFWEDLLNSIDDGHFKTLDDVLAEFNHDYWVPTEEEITQLKKHHEDYLSTLDKAE